MQCLEGIVVLDLSRGYPQAFASAILGDYGAEVIRVDPPGAGLVGWGDGDKEKYAAYYPFDRNKRSMVLDFKQEAARAAFVKLVQRADVLIEGFRPGVMDRLGLGYQKLSADNPRLIYCALSGFGQDGPYAHLPGHDPNYLGIAGVLSMIGERNGQPHAPSNFIADMAGAGLHGALGVLLALQARERTGKGQYIDISFTDASINLICASAAEYFQTGSLSKRGEAMATGGMPCGQIYRCKDGEYFSAMPVEPQFWVNFCRALGREDFIPEHSATGARGDQVIAELRAIFATRTRDEWWEFLREKQTCVGPVYNLNETFADPQVLHRQMVVEVDHPKYGKVRHTGIPIKLSDTPGAIRRAGVPAGTDSEAILGELGYGGDEIQRLRASGALG